MKDAAKPVAIAADQRLQQVLEKTTAAALALTAVMGSVSGASAQTSLVLGTASVGGTYYVYGGVVAQILSDKARLQIIPQQTQGPNQNVIMIDNGKIDGCTRRTFGSAVPTTL